MPDQLGAVKIQLFDGTRQPFSDDVDIFVTATDGNLKVQRRIGPVRASIINITELPLFDNAGDNYIFGVSANGYKNSGVIGVAPTRDSPRIINVMLIPDRNSLNFADSTWTALDQSRPELKKLLAQGAATPAAAADRYSRILEGNGGFVLACLLNITTAMQQIHLPQGTPFDYLKEIIFDSPNEFPMKQDRFYAWADLALKKQLEQAEQQNPPQFADAPFILHPGATSSFKQITFDEANVQLTFHENNKRNIGGVDCVILEPDIDYFENALNHLILEVLLNEFHGLTDPRQVFVLRWIAGQRAGIAEFNPLYTIVKA